MKNLVRSYSTSAKYYDDAYAVKADLTDLPFYVDLAKKAGGPVLEIGCGTGRVLLPIARHGIEIHGVDNSLPMLSVLKKRLRQESREVRQNVRLHRGDMRHFRLNRKYPLVIMPFRPLQHMRTVDDQVRALASAAFHLKSDGLFAFDLFFPKFEKIPGGIGEEILELEWRDSTNPTRVVRRVFSQGVRRQDQPDIHRNVFLPHLSGRQTGKGGNRAINHVLLYLPASARSVPARRPRTL